MEPERLKAAIQRLVDNRHTPEDIQLLQRALEQGQIEIAGRDQIVVGDLTKTTGVAVGDGAHTTVNYSVPPEVIELMLAREDKSRGIQACGLVGIVISALAIIIILSGGLVWYILNQSSGPAPAPLETTSPVAAHLNPTTLVPTPLVPTTAVPPPTAVLPAATSAPAGTPSPTLPLPAFHVLDDFSSTFDDAKMGRLDPSKWCEVIGEIAPRVDQGQLSLEIESPGNYNSGSIRPCKKGRNFQSAAMQVAVTGGTYWGSIFLETSYDSAEGKGYVDFGLSENGEIYLNYGLEGVKTKVLELTWPGGGVGVPHILGFEWTGQELQFYIDGRQPGDIPPFPTGRWGSYLVISAVANLNGKITNAIDWVGWNYH